MPGNKSHIVTVEKIIPGGFGLGRSADGKVVLVPYTLPGEKVDVEPVKQRKSYQEARLVEVLTPSKERVDPPCSHYMKCGGCDFQHIEQATQLLLKHQILAELLQRSSISEQVNINQILEDPLASPDSYGYRQRIRLHVSDENKLGFYQYHSHNVEPISSCPLADPKINEILAQLNNSRAMTSLAKHAEAVEILLSPDEDNVVLYLRYIRKPRPADKNCAVEIEQTIEGVKSILMTVAGHVIFGPFGSEKKNSSDISLIKFTLPSKIVGRDMAMTLEPGGFCQVNHKQNENLIQLVLEWATVSLKDRVLDLYCGMGNFSLPLALGAKEVVGMDSQRSAIRSAIRNGQLAEIENCRFEKQSALDGAKELLNSKESFDIVLLDPPRQGCAEIVPYLSELATKRIVYISCDPATLVRDLNQLINLDFEIQRMKVVDMFPQTHHLEVVTLLERNKSKKNPDRSFRAG